MVKRTDKNSKSFQKARRKSLVKVVPNNWEKRSRGWGFKN